MSQNMCGFAGIVTWSERLAIDGVALERMSARIAHRGPDAHGMYLSDGPITPDRPQVGLAHRRLAVLDLEERANQPFADDAGRSLVYNGEIYNFRELRAELSALRPDYAWRTTCDTEVLLLAHAVWGIDALPRLNGMFAFAIWDEAKGTLVLARDRSGQKPLYMCRAPGGGAVAFASELPALREVPWFDASLDAGALADYLRWGYVADRTIFASVSKLAPGHYQRISAKGVECKRFADINGTPGEAADRANTRTLVEQAVRRQMVSDVPIGCFLSGGIDSSIVALCMCRAGGQNGRVLTFSIGFDDPRYDETAYAAAVARNLGTEHREFIIRPDAAADLPLVASAFGEPFGDSSGLPTYYLARETRKHVKVALAGDGGDELFGGYDRYRAVAIAQKMDHLPAPLRGLIAVAARRMPGVHPKGTPARLKRFVSSLGLPAPDRYAGYLRLFDEPTLRRLLSDVPPAVGPEPAGLYQQMLRAGRDPVQSALATDRLSYLPEDLHTKVDRASMAFALEVRSPFMDVDLLQFAAGLETDQLFNGGSKRLLREAFAADLPEFVFHRRKMGFAVPIGDWFRTSLRSMLHDAIGASDSFARGHFSRPAIQHLIEEHEKRRRDHGQRLYALLMLELWWRELRTGE